MSYLLKNPNYDANFASLKLEDNLIVENVQINNNLQVDEDTLLNNVEITGVCVIPSISLDNLTAKTLELKLNTAPNVVNNQDHESIILQNTPSNLRCSIEAGEILIDNLTPAKATRVEYDKVSLVDNTKQVNITPLQGVELLNTGSNVQALLSVNGLNLNDAQTGKSSSYNAQTLTVEEIVSGVSPNQYTLPNSKPVLSNSYLTCNETTGVCSWSNNILPLTTGQVSLNLMDDGSNVINNLIVDYQVLNNVVNLRLSLQNPSFSLPSSTNYLYSAILPNAIAPLLSSNDLMEIASPYFYWAGSNHARVSIFIQEISGAYRIFIYPQAMAGTYSQQLTYFGSGNCIGFQAIHNLKPPTGGTQTFNLNYVNCLPYFINL
jgi:hypothetical protein